MMSNIEMAESNSSKNKRSGGDTAAEPDKKKARVQRKWEAYEVENILVYLNASIKNGKGVEKPTADEYYTKMLPKLSIPGCSVSQLKNKVKNLRELYTKTIMWRKQTGQGILETDGVDTLERVTSNRCPHFKELDEIFGIRLNIKPPFILDSAVVVEDDQDFFQELPSSILVENPTSNDTIVEMSSAKTVNDVQCESPKPTTSKSAKCTPTPTGLNALIEARRQKTTADNKKYDVDVLKLNFEKEKWVFESKMRDRLADLEEKKIDNVRHKIDLKYKTKLEIAKLSKP